MDEEKFVDTVEKDGEEYQIRDQRVNGLEDRLNNNLNEVRAEIREKQDKLVSGVNIKTVNHQDLLGAGNINLSINPEDYYTKEETIEVVDEKTAVVDNKLDANVHIESNQDEITYSGDTVTKTSQYKNLKTGATGTRSEVIHLANSTTAGLMAHADYNQIRSNTSRIEALEGQTKRLLYSEKTNPTAQEIQDFVDDYLESIGVTPSPIEYVSIAVVVSGTYHIWHYYTDPGEWRDDGVDTVTQFTNDSPGVIQGKATDGFVYAENDGSGSVYGWDSLKTRVTNVEDNQSNFVTKTTNPDKVYGTDSNGNQTTYNKDDFGQIEDVQVNGTSVVTDKIANIDLSSYVDLSSEQTITGVKTFSNEVIFKNTYSRIYESSTGLTIMSSTGNIRANSNLFPAVNNNKDLGSSSFKWKDLYLSGKLKDGTNEIAISEIARNDLIADEYDNTQTYAVGDLCLHNMQLYKCITAISTAEDFDSSKWIAVKINGEFVDLSSEQTITSQKSFIGNNEYNYTLRLKPNVNSSAYGGMALNGSSHLIFIAGTTSRMSLTGSSLRPLINLDLGQSSNKWKDLYLSGGFNPNTNGYKLTLPDTTSWTADKEIATTDQAFKIIEASEIGAGNVLTQAQYNLIIAAPRSLPVLIRGNLAGNYDTMLCGMAVSSQGVNGIAINGRNIHSFHINSSTRAFTFDSSNADDYLKIKGTNVNDIINGTFNVINASDIVNNTLTPAQFDLITNGKPTLIKGQYGTRYEIWLEVGIIYSSNYNCECKFTNQFGAHYRTAIRIPATSPHTLSFNNSGIYFNYQGDNVSLPSLSSVNGKAIPAYPSNTGTFGFKSVNGTLSWQQEWYGTQAQYDALGTYDSNTIYNILES